MIISINVDYIAGDINTAPNDQLLDVDFSDYEHVDDAFSVFTRAIYHILLSKVQFEDLRRACIENVNTPFGAKLPCTLIESIKATKCLRDLFDELASSPYWSWINIRMLEKMVNVSCVPEANQLVKQYKDAVFSRKLSLLFKQIPKFPIPSDYYTKVQQKWNKNLDEVTVKDLVSHWSQMEEVFGGKEPSLLLHCVLDGCVEIHWYISTELMLHACGRVFNARHALKDILQLSIGNYTIICNDGRPGKHSVLRSE